MKVDRRALFEALKLLLPVADQRASLPILGHVLLEADGDRLALSATNIGTTLSHTLRAEAELHTCLPVKLLSSLIKPEGKGSGDVVIEEIGDSTCSVVVEGFSGRLAAMSADEFPKGTTEGWSLVSFCPAAPLLESLAFVLPAASTDDGRPHLNSILLDTSRIVATDGHRLHMAPAPGRLIEPLLLSLDSVQTLSRIVAAAEQVVIARAGDQVRFGAGPWQLTTRLVEAQFPPYEKVVPARETLPVQVQLEQALFSKGLGRVSRLTKDRAVRLRINGAITMTASDPDLGEAVVVVPVVSSNHCGEDLVLGADPAYLRDAIAAGSGRFEMSLRGPTDAVRFDLDRDRVAIVMPHRI